MIDVQGLGNSPQGRLHFHCSLTYILRHRLISKLELKAIRNLTHQPSLCFPNFSLSAFFFVLSVRNPYSVKISHEIPLYDIHKNGVVSVNARQGTRTKPSCPGGSPTSMVAPEAHPKNPQSAEDLSLKTMGQAPLRLWDMRKWFREVT